MAEKKGEKTARPAAKKAVPRVDQADHEAATVEKIAAMLAPYRAMGERLHALILRSAPALQRTVWYGMPAYAKDGKTVCFFRADKKYMTFGFTQEANLACEEGAPHQLIESSCTSLRWMTRRLPGFPISYARSRADGALRAPRCEIEGKGDV